MQQTNKQTMQLKFQENFLIYIHIGLKDLRKGIPLYIKTPSLWMRNKILEATKDVHSSGSTLDVKDFQKCKNTQDLLIRQKCSLLY